MSSLDAAAASPHPSARAPRQASPLRRLYFVRFGFAIAWAAVFGATSSPLADVAFALAALFVLLRDGVMAAGCLADPDEVTTVFRAGLAQTSGLRLCGL